MPSDPPSWPRVRPHLLVSTHSANDEDIGSSYVMRQPRPDDAGQLAPLPRFDIDRSEADWPQTDLLLQIRLLQIRADSPVSVAHAQRRLVVGAESLAVQRWVQRGFREPLTASRRGMPFRNLFGQVDGTIQPAVDGSADGLIWIGAGDTAAPHGLDGGSSLVIRRIAMNMDTWDEVDRAAREIAVSRRLASGAHHRPGRAGRPRPGGDRRARVSPPSTRPRTCDRPCPTRHTDRTSERRPPR